MRTGALRRPTRATTDSPTWGEQQTNHRSDSNQIRKLQLYQDSRKQQAKQGASRQKQQSVHRARPPKTDECMLTQIGADLSGQEQASSLTTSPEPSSKSCHGCGSCWRGVRGAASRGSRDAQIAVSDRESISDPVLHPWRPVSCRCFAPSSPPRRLMRSRPRSRRSP